MVNVLFSGTEFHIGNNLNIITDYRFGKFAPKLKSDLLMVPLILKPAVSALLMGLTTVPK